MMYAILGAVWFAGFLAHGYVIGRTASVREKHPAEFCMALVFSAFWPLTLPLAITIELGSEHA